jgi:hypothetical protein
VAKREGGGKGEISLESQLCELLGNSHFAGSGSLGAGVIGLLQVRIVWPQELSPSSITKVE